ncbi:MAG: hypothetical protein L0H99_00750 [Loigolactobacillus coryniformis]|jgi:hypothetical protein|uniref:hypothetical protein n=1 Tax=Loigolactobacillus coryniformis TaxID=1610 RepID=UPI00031D6051|nr:hypothetical protein [Loigolactobacillus coryniformis]MBW4801769.1 hypothetical protein [Loigolactobacillus coryniformis subsp. torquens]MBW4804470.1 hypothetical protein [Loigolactobacillus coryniformis subsp. torquens]MDN5952406.1 hypothetical protein [Loigolactobacillus coryniformis]
MSKHKRIASVQAEAAAQKNVDTILQNMHKGQKTIASLPKWSQELAHHRFGWSELISFLPLIIITLTSPLLSSQVSMGQGLVVNKNALFIIPFASLLISAGCYLNVKIRRKGERITDIDHFAMNEIFTLLSNVVVVALCSGVLIYQLIRVFTA